MTPVLYSFRRCPYAIRARLTLRMVNIDYELREVSLKHKPEAMLALSPKATVPVLHTATGVIDESLDVMRWAFINAGVSRDEGHAAVEELQHALVVDNDQRFKPRLDRYKYFERYPEQTQQHYFEQCTPFLSSLEDALVIRNAGRLSATDNIKEQPEYCLINGELSPIDLAILPFVRQFALVDLPRFESLPFTRLKQWLSQLLESSLFESVMVKQPLWQPSTN